MTESVIKNGTKKNDVFEIELGNGTSYEINGKSGGKDTITFVSQDSLTPMDFTYTQAKDGDVLTKDLIITKGSDTIRIKDYFTTTEANSTKSSIKYIEIDNIKIPLNAMFFYQGEYGNKKGVINGTMFSDNITGTNGNDKIYGNGGLDQIAGGKGNDYIIAKDCFAFMIDGGEDDDTLKATNSLGLESAIIGGAGNDNIYSNSLMTIIDGGEGDDIIRTGSYKMDAYTSSLMESGISMIWDFYDVDPKYSLHIIQGGAGNDKIYSGSGSDFITYGSDSFEDTPENEGHDIIYSANKNDALVFNEEIVANLEFNKEGNNLVIKTGEDSSITLSKFFKAKKGNALDKFIVEGVQHSILNDAIINVTGKGKINGTNYNDNITGSDKKDTIKTGKGVNIVDGNGGNDYIDSTKGNNTIIINNGDGNDTILAGANSETHLEFYGGAIFEYYKNGDDLIITHQSGAGPIDLNEEFNNTSETVTLKNYFKTDKKGYLINKNVTINDNFCIYSGEELLKVLQEQDISVLGKENKANKIDLRKYQDTFDFNVIGGNKNDKIYLGAGDHIISSGAGNDTITVGNGDNTINMGAGKDKVKAGNGDNTFYYTSGKDIIESGIGDDKYYVEYSSDMNLTIKDNGGYDRLYTENIDNNDLHVFLNINKSGDIVVSDNKSAILNNVYIFGSDEEGNSMLSYENILKGMKGKDMSGVIEIERCLEKSFDINNAEIKFIEGRGYIEQINNGGLNIEEIASEVGNWLSSYKNGAFESSVDVLSRGSQDDINAMLTIYNNHEFSEYE